MVIDAVVRNLEIIGEASNNIPKEIMDKYDSITWSENDRIEKYNST